MRVRNIGYIFILLFVYFTLINKISFYFLTDRTSYELPLTVLSKFIFYLSPWLNFDGRNFLQIVLQGYNQSYLLAFFPLYPITIKILSFVVNPIYAGLVISYTAFIVAIYLYGKLLDLLNIKNKAKNILLLLSYPTSYYFFSYYSESLYFLLVILFFYFYFKREKFGSILVAVLASMTRMVGVSLLFILLYDMVKTYFRDRKITYSYLFAPLGMISFFFFSYLKTGKLLAYVSSQSTWERKVNILSPIFSIYDAVVKIIKGPQSSYDSPFVYVVIVLEFVTLMFIIYWFLKYIKERRVEFNVYIGINLLLVLYSGILSAIPRFSLVLFPILLDIAKHSSRRVFIFYVVIFIILQVLLSSLFLRGYWVA